MNMGTSSSAIFSLQISNIFVEAWIYLNSPLGSVNMIAQHGTGSGQDWGFWTDGSGNLHGFIYGTSGTSTYIEAITSGGISATTWYHVAFSFDSVAKSSRVYINGSTPVTVTNAAVTPNYTPSLPFWIGNYANTYYFTGYIRDLRVVQGGAVPTSSFTPGTAPFSYASPNYVAGMGTTVFTLLGQFITYVPGKYGQSIYFQNTAGGTPSCQLVYNPIPAFSSATTGFTFSYWVNFTSQNGNPQMQFLLATGVPGSVNPYGGISIYLRGDGILFVVNHNNPDLIPASGIVTNKWYHIAFTFFKGVLCVYFNGVNTATSGTILDQTYTYLQLAGNYNTYALNGSIDDLRIYKTALSAMQVQALYANGGAPGNPQSTTMGGVSISPNLWWTFNGTFIESITGINVNSGGTIGVTPFAAGIYGQALYMQTAATYQQYLYSLSSSLATTNGFTASMWLNSATDTGSGIGIYGPTVGGVGLIVRWGIQSGGYPYVNYYDPNDGVSVAFRVVQSPTILPYNKWYNIGFVLGGSINKTLTLYVNGVQKGSTTYTTDMSGTTLYGGMNLFRNGNYYIQDLRVYTSALTAAQMNSIYNQTAVPVTKVSYTGTSLFSQLSLAAVTSAMGAFSLRAVNGVSAKAVNVVPGGAFPISGFSSAAVQSTNQFTQSLTGYPFTGSYVVNCSSYYSSTGSGEQPWYCFDKNNNGTWWTTATASYTITTGVYNGAVSTPISGSAYLGEWIQIQLPVAIILTSYTIYNASSWNGRAPQNFKLAGSNDGNTWILIDTQTGITSWASSTTSLTFTPSVQTTGYTYFRLCVNLINGVTSYPFLSIGELILNGTAFAQFPPSAMTGSTTVISGYPYGGSGSYISSASSRANANFIDWHAFDKSNTGDGWASSLVYSGITYSGSQTTLVSSVSYSGEWLQIQCPSVFIASSITIICQYNAGGPRTFVFAGSIDGITWDLLINQTTATNLSTNNSSQSFSISTNTAYSYYRLILTSSYSVYGQIGELLIFAQLNQDFYADRLGNLLTVPISGQTLTNWLGSATGYVTTWYDQSGKGNHANQTTAANQPIIQKATKGPGYMILFTGGQYLTGFSYTALNNTNYTICTSTRRTANAGSGTPYQNDNPILVCGTSGTTNGYLHITYRNGNTYLNAQYSNDQLVTITGFATASTEPIRYGFGLCSSTSGRNIYLYNDPLGVPIKIQTTGSTGTLSMLSGNLVIGQIIIPTVAPAENAYYIGEMYEILIFKASFYDTDGTTSTNVPTTVQTIYNNQLSYTGT
jgi:hypothetical protein